MQLAKTCSRCALHAIQSLAGVEEASDGNDRLIGSRLACTSASHLCVPFNDDGSGGHSTNDSGTRTGVGIVRDKRAARCIASTAHRTI